MKAGESAEVVGSTIAKRFLHGDLIPGNLLVRRADLTAVIDWGGAGIGDPAQDLAPAWAIFELRARRIFRDAVSADEEMWLRARAFELEHAVGGILLPTQRSPATQRTITWRRRYFLSLANLTAVLASLILAVLAGRRPNALGAPPPTHPAWLEGPSTRGPNW